METEQITAFPYYGGKNNRKTLVWLLERLPLQHGYLEPFGGSAAILLNRPRSVVETFNDLNQDVVNFFRQMRDNGPELIRRIQLTPYSRLEFEKSLKLVNGSLEGRASDLVEWARCFYVLARQTFVSRQTSATWSFTRESNMLKSFSWASGIAKLDAVLLRFYGVQIENDDALKVIRRYDTEDLLIYQDPPYLMSTRTRANTYNAEVGIAFHRALSRVNLNAKGKIAISGYDSDLYRELYEERSGWWRFESPPQLLASSAASTGVKGIPKTRTRSMSESLWCNYDAEDIASRQESSGQMQLDQLIDEEAEDGEEQLTDEK